MLYRQRLQVERDLRAGAMAGEAVVGADTPGIDGPADALASVARMLRQGASALVEAATDDETIEALDKLAGPRWRLAAQAADVALVAARAAVRGADGKAEDGAGAEVEAGEPTPFRRTVEADDETDEADDGHEAHEATGTTGRS